MRRAQRVDWINRRGELIRVTKAIAYIRWDGRKTVDHFHPCLVETV
jgi:hypothetical protein